MHTTPLKDILISVDAMDANQISSFTEQTYQKKTYSALEVYPTNTIIQSGTYDAATGLKYIVDVPSCDTLYLHMYCYSEHAHSDVFIDFGDNQIVKFSEHQFISPEMYSDTGLGYYQVKILHKYSNSFINKKNIVKIYGNDYFMLRGFDTSVINPRQNIISRIMEKDLPIASNLKNVSSICNGSLRILRFTPVYCFDNAITNWSYMFKDCKNLQTVDADDSSIQLVGSYAVNGIFQNCENLKTSNMRIPPYVGAGEYQYCYSNCLSLSANINDLLPKTGFNGSEIRMLGTFSNCQKIYGIVPSTKLWADPSKYFNVRYGGLRIVDELPSLSDYTVVRIARDPLVYSTLPDLPTSNVVECQNGLPPTSEADPDVLYWLRNPTSDKAQYSVYKYNANTQKYEYVLNTEYEVRYETSTHTIKRVKIDSQNKLYYSNTASSSTVYKIEIANFFQNELIEHPPYYIYNVDENGELDNVILDLTEYAKNNIVLNAYNQEYDLQADKLDYVGIYVNGSTGKMSFTKLNYTGNVFAGCSSSILQQVPKLFGGTKQIPSMENITKNMFANMSFVHSDDNQMNDMSQQIEELVTVLGGNLNN